MYRVTNEKLRIFLTEAEELGRQVWTSFNLPLMHVSSFLLLLSSLLQIFFLPIPLPLPTTLSQLAIPLLLLYHVAITPFSNSYLNAQSTSYSFSLSVSVLSLIPTLPPSAPLKIILSVPLLSRLHETFVHGHGADLTSSLPFLHPAAYITSTIAVLCMRLRNRKITNPSNALLVLPPLLTLSHWLLSSQTLGLLSFTLQTLSLLYHCTLHPSLIDSSHDLLSMFVLLTGPSCATSSLILTVQSLLLSHLHQTLPTSKIPTYAKAAIVFQWGQHAWRATGHEASFSKVRLRTSVPKDHGETFLI